MISDIVVDTNVFVHANNPDDANRQRNSLMFLQTLEAATTSLCVDEGFDFVNEAQNRSHIAREYLKHIRAGMFGHYLLAKLATTARIVIVSRTVPAWVKTKIKRMPNKTDQTFVRVTFNSQSKEMTSHDFDDFPPRVRRTLRDDIGVNVRSADHSTPLLT